MIKALIGRLRGRLAGRSARSCGPPTTRCLEQKVLLDSLIDKTEGSHLDIAQWGRLKSDFLMGGVLVLHEATPFLWEYYKSFASGFSPSERREYGIPELEDSRDIWEEVTFAHPPEFRPGSGELEPAAGYLSFEGEVSWEPEHGLQLVFESGAKVCKVGPYDGHVTTAHAWGDSLLLGVVFR